MHHDSAPGPIGQAFQEGTGSSEQAITALRDACALAPDDLERRARLLGALTFSRSRRSPEPAAEFVDEVVWWIRRHPIELQHVIPALAVLSHAPFATYQRVREAWDDVLPTHSESPDVLLAAAQSFSHHEADRALELLAQAHAATDHDVRPAQQAGHIWWLRSTRFRREGIPDHDQQEATAALRWFEKALERRTHTERPASILETACDAALAAGDLSGARAFAEELLELSRSGPSNWNTGNAIYAAHSTLGRIALREGVLDRAKEHLMLAGQTPGSPQLESFGPELDLAHELLQRGERTAVVEFLRDIRKFWKSGRDRIDRWTLKIEQGETPTLSRFDFRS